MIGCVASTLFNCFIGALWYSTRLPTGRLWARRTYPGKTESQMSKDLGFAMGFSIVVSVILSLLLRFILIDFFKSTSLLDAFKFGVGLSCITTLLELPHVLFTRRYFDVFLIDQVYNLVVVVGGGLCIVYFG